jgi:transcriptional regulator with XRE-family HTH domain
VNIGERLRDLRELKHLSQGDIEKRSGLLRCYISRVEHGHTVPAIETLEKLARPMDIPLYRLLYDGNEPPKAPEMPKRVKHDDKLWGATGRDARTLREFVEVLSQTSENDRELLLFMARKMARRSRARV